MIHPLRNGILFAFVDTVTNGKFNEDTNWGFNLGQSPDASGQTARWAKVLSIGPEVEEIQNGDYIQIEPLMWSHGFKHKKTNIWKTDESKVIFVSPTLP